MKTDTLFYQIFQLLPELLGQLIGNASTINYSFTSVEIKELARRVDGVFLPPEDEPDQRLYFAEIQFQKDDGLYERLLTETFLYLGQYRPQRLWQAVAIWASASLDRGIPTHYQELHSSGLLKVIYLDRLPDVKTLGFGLVKLVTAKAKRPEEAQPQVARLRELVADLANDPREREIIELIDKALMCKFPQLTPEELQEMFGLAELKETKFYQEALKEGKLQTVPILVRLGMSVEEIASELELEIELVQKAIDSGNSPEEEIS